jgi:tripartite-type tricarboxylate transporter receptor subunit TctC
VTGREHAGQNSRPRICNCARFAFALARARCVSEPANPLAGLLSAGRQPRYPWAAARRTDDAGFRQSGRGRKRSGCGNCDGRADDGESSARWLHLDPVKDFTPITALAAVPTILVANPQVKAPTLSDFIALAKREPGKITYGSGGVGSIHHLTMAIFADQTGIDVLHVPYRAGTAMVNGLLTGEIQVGWSGIPNVISGIGNGQLRGYCISVLERSPSEPAIPTCDELGIKGFDAAAVLGLYAPAGAPPQVVTRLAAEAAKIMREPAMTARMDQLGMLMRENGTASYVEFRKQDAQRYANIVHKLNLHVN